MKINSCWEFFVGYIFFVKGFLEDCRERLKRNIPLKCMAIFTGLVSLLTFIIKGLSESLMFLLAVGIGTALILFAIYIAAISIQSSDDE